MSEGSRLWRNKLANVSLVILWLVLTVSQCFEWFGFADVSMLTQLAISWNSDICPIKLTVNRLDHLRSYQTFFLFLYRRSLAEL